MIFDAREFLESLYAEPTATAQIRTPDELPGDWRELYEERAAIRECDGGQAREHAEAEALAEVLARMRVAYDL